MRCAVVYRVFTAAGDLLYVGASVAPLERFGMHQSKPWWRDVATITLEHFPDPDSALDAEVEAIRLEHPRYNKRRIRGTFQRFAYNEGRPTTARQESLSNEIAELRCLVLNLLAELRGEATA